MYNRKKSKSPLPTITPSVIPEKVKQQLEKIKQQLRNKHCHYASKWFFEFKRRYKNLSVTDEKMRDLAMAYASLKTDALKKELDKTYLEFRNQNPYSSFSNELWQDEINFNNELKDIAKQLIDSELQAEASAKKVLKIFQEDIRSSTLLSPVAKRPSFFSSKIISFEKSPGDFFTAPAHLKKMLDTMQKANKNRYSFRYALCEILKIAALASKNKPLIGKRGVRNQTFYEKYIFDLLGIDVAATLKKIKANIDKMDKTGWGTWWHERPKTVDKILTIVNDENTATPPLARLIKVINLAQEAAASSNQLFNWRSNATDIFYENFLFASLVVDENAPHRKQDRKQARKNIKKDNIYPRVEHTKRTTAIN